ncbi:MAG: lysophospholipid acyltransferase family protein [Caldiserica bacterium]|nr:lysophospholipid acyltransferase family protein [Caldisericota bacterium]
MESLIAHVSLIYLHLVKMTIRWEKHLNKNWEKENLIWVFWHNRLFLFILFYLKFLKGKKFVALISPSRDGELIARIGRKMGISSIRGSSKHFSLSAAKEIRRYLQAGYHLIIIPDGPRGPRYQLKEGVLWISEFSRIPILPLHFSISRYKVIPSWDRFIFPLPFAKEKIIAPFTLLAEKKNNWEETKREIEKLLGRDIENQG